MDRTAATTLLQTARARLLEHYPAQVAACLAELDDEAVWWRPHEQSNAVANLVLHLIGSNHYYLEHAIAGRALQRDRDAEFSARGGVSCAALGDRWRVSLAGAAEVLAGLDPARLVETTDRTGKPSSIAQILLHVTHHNAAHMGQIVWITKMLRPGRLDDVWRKTKAR